MPNCQGQDGEKGISPEQHEIDRLATKLAPEIKQSLTRLPRNVS
jgi:hypothetical protein